MNQIFSKLPVKSCDKLKVLQCTIMKQTEFEHRFSASVYNVMNVFKDYQMTRLDQFPLKR